MAKYVCNVCGYVHEGDEPPIECPICKAPAEKFTKQEGEMTWAAEHVVGVAQGAPDDIMKDLRANFNGECMEVGMYLAMARVAYREGYPEIGEYWRRAALEEAEHAAKFAELLGEVCAWKQRTEPPPARPIWQNVRRLSISTRFTTPCTKWRAMKLVTAKLLRVC